MALLALPELLEPLPVVITPNLDLLSYPTRPILSVVSRKTLRNSATLKFLSSVSQLHLSMIQFSRGTQTFVPLLTLSTLVLYSISRCFSLKTTPARLPVSRSSPAQSTTPTCLARSSVWICSSPTVRVDGTRDGTQPTPLSRF